MNKHWQGSYIVGAAVVWKRKRWIVHSWNKKTRDLTLIDMYDPYNVDIVNDPLFMQWEK